MLYYVVLYSILLHTPGFRSVKEGAALQGSLRRDPYFRKAYHRSFRWRTGRVPAHQKRWGPDRGRRTSCPGPACVRASSAFAKLAVYLLKDRPLLWAASSAWFSSDNAEVWSLGCIANDSKNAAYQVDAVFTENIPPSHKHGTTVRRLGSVTQKKQKKQ